MATPPPRLPWGYWTAERVAWLTAAYQRHPMPDLVAIYNAHWQPRDGFALTASQVKTGITNHGLVCHRVGIPKGARFAVWTPEQLHWLRATRDDQTLEDLLCQFNDRFGVNRSVFALAAICKRHGILGTRDTRFQPGHPSHNKGLTGWTPGGRSLETRFSPEHNPHNAYPLGSHKRHASGYWIVKYRHGGARGGQASQENWIFAHRLIWQEAHGPIPKAHVIAFLDGDLDNLSLDNLVCLSRTVHHQWNRLLDAHPAATLEQRLLTLERARIKCQVYERARDTGMDWKTTHTLFHGRKPGRSSDRATQDHTAA